MQFILHKRWIHHLLAPLAGCLLTLSLAPFDLWPLAPLSIALLYLLLQEATSRQALLTGWLFGFGLFASGASWVYVSIHDYGAAPPLLAGFLTLLFVAALALFHALQAWLWVRYLRHPEHRLLNVPAFAVLWVAMEAFRGWFLTGFPWLYAGYSQLEGPLAGLAPLGGVWLISLVLAMSGPLLVQLFCHRLSRRQTLTRALLLPLLWLGSMPLHQHEWTRPAGQPLSVSVFQGNIEQNLKWDPDQLAAQLDLYREMTLDAATADILLWPETAVPLFQDSARPWLDFMHERALERGSALITGIPVRHVADDGRRSFYNGITVLGEGSGDYLKQKLVPFGEYVPLQDWLRGLIEFFDLPMSDFARGPAGQPPLQARGHSIAPYICYEVVYPEFATRLAAQSEILLTISNDTWFGRSIGPLQHLQMAQMRALEAGRWMIRGTNNGISVLVNPFGQITAEIPQFEQAVLHGQVVPMQGLTPYLRFGSWPLGILCTLLLLFAIQQKRKH
ncbi:apolipoprotein N-acyltransferase [Thiopseudomonas denitrificans]|uniref:Apolipoprotein N-acyltransferase n=1 Tax=Thiopseudomonas denitrificans TaxID=1501432 RepID=A0A4R6TSM6_9GAMM|nr:apolipoprotein N-acyltransferase [Thiopseudomonas denitrificans]TDQ36311.1 apolipoprotein N-acyltransferase [Thiopseudomonas denitrificans]